MSEALERRARLVRSRAAVRSWEYRQRNLSKGVWFRLRRVLAEAKEAWAISPESFAALVAEGHAPEAVGDELAPSRRIVFAPAERLAAIEERRAIPVSLAADFFEAPAVALVRFPSRGGSPPVD